MFTTCLLSFPRLISSRQSEVILFWMSAKWPPKCYFGKLASSLYDVMMKGVSGFTKLVDDKKSKRQRMKRLGLLSSDCF